MQLLSTLSALLSLALSIQAADTSIYPKSIKLSYEIIGSGKPLPLAEVFYNPSTAKSHLSSWTPPSTDGLKSTSPEPVSSPLVRVSLPDGSSSVASLTAFDPSLSQHINLWLSPGADGTIFSASIASISPPPLSEEEIRQQRKEERARAKGKPIPSPKPTPKASKSKKGKKAAPEQEPGGPVVKVNILRAREGPKAHLHSRAPPQVDSEGREVPQQPEQEKTFFQKYWWVFMAATVLMMAGGGGAEK